jgi:ribosomal protein S18 acetylase RimI-like enzyme
MQVSPDIELEKVGTTDPEVRRLYADFVVEADGRLGIDLSEDIENGPPPDLRPPNGALLLARVDGEAAGLAGVRHLDTDVAEVKSMYVVPTRRGRGLGRLLLREVEKIAAARDCSHARLDTSDYLTAAIDLYRSAGYREVSDYNGNAKANLWFQRSLRSAGQL